MNLVLDLVKEVAILFVMMLPGVILKKCKLISDGFGKGLSNLVLYIAQPVLVFNAYLEKSFSTDVLLNAAMVLVLSVIAHGVFAAVALMLFKREPDAKQRMLRFATIFANAAFMGIPLIDAMLGSEATLYATIYNITFNIFLWTLGVHICTGDRDFTGDGKIDKDIEEKHKSEASIGKALLHPVTVAAVIGLVAFFFSLGEYTPQIVFKGLGMIKGLVAPLSMIVIGLRLADMNFKGFLNDVGMWIFLLMRHIALPAAVFLIMWGVSLLGVPLSDTVIKVVLILASAPAATSATMFAEKYDCDSAYVSRLVAFSTILCIATMPLIILLADLI